MTLAATCEAAGSAYETCVLCGATEPAELPAAGHALEKRGGAAYGVLRGEYRILDLRALRQTVF